MALQVDSSAPLRTSAELAILVKAVLGAAPEDESRAIEWKSAFTDLRELHASFTIARAVLGLANRPVALARQDFEGLGYVVIGATPGVIEHQHLPDSADLLSAIGRFTGHGSPYFDPRSVRLEGKDVLVVVVQPPQDGDRIALLQRSYQPVRGPQVEEGTIFVRRPGSTQRGSRQEIEALQDRLLAGVEATAAAGRRDDRRREARDLVADLVHAGTQWTSAQRAHGLASTEAKKDRKFFFEWVNTDSGRAMAANRQTVAKAVSKIRLLVKDGPLLQAAAAADDLLGDSDVYDSVFSSKPQTDAEAGTARAAAYGHLNQIDSALRALEVVAARELGDLL